MVIFMTIKNTFSFLFLILSTDTVSLESSLSYENIPASVLDPQGERAQSGASDYEAPGFGAILNLLDTDGCPPECRSCSIRSTNPR